MCSSVVACAVKIHELIRLQNDYNCTTVQPVSMCALKTESIFYRNHNDRRQRE